MIERLHDIESEEKISEVDRLIHASEECQTLQRLFEQLAQAGDGGSIQYLEGHSSGQHRIHRSESDGFDFTLTHRLNLDNPDFPATAEISIETTGERQIPSSLASKSDGGNG